MSFSKKLTILVGFFLILCHSEHAKCCWCVLKIDGCNVAFRYDEKFVAIASRCSWLLLQYFGGGLGSHCAVSRACLRLWLFPHAIRRAWLILATMLYMLLLSEYVGQHSLPGFHCGSDCLLLLLSSWCCANALAFFLCSGLSSLLESPVGVRIRMGRQSATRSRSLSAPSLRLRRNGCL